MSNTRVSQCVESLLEEICDGVFPAESSLPPEAELAAHLDVSRPTMREAVRSLSERGVLKVQHGRGTFVQPMSNWTDAGTIVKAVSRERSPREVGVYLTEVRTMIEVGSAGLAAQKATELDLKRLTQAIKRYEEAHDADNAAEAARFDMEFHDLILQATGNPFAHAVLRSLGGPLEASRLGTSSIPEVRERALIHHRAILDALASRDPEAAQKAMLRHMKQTRGDVEKFLES